MTRNCVTNYPQVAEVRVFLVAVGFWLRKNQNKKSNQTRQTKKSFGGLEALYLRGPEEDSNIEAAEPNKNNDMVR